MAEYKIRIVVEGEDRASGPLRGIAGALGQMGTIAGGIGLASVLGGVAQGAQQAGAAMVGMVTDAGELESQIDAIGAVSGASAGEMVELAGLIGDLGINPNLKVSTNEAADAIEMLVRNGLTLDEVFAGAAEQTVLLANSTGAEFGTAADIATDAMSIFSIQAEDMGQAVDGIAGVVAASKFDITDYQMALAQGGAAAAVAGVSFDEFNTAVAGISSNFASGSDAGTSLKTMIQRLIPQSDEAAAAMGELGLEFFNADGSMRGMAEVAGELNRAMAGLSAEQRISYLSTIFGTDAMRAAAAVASYTEEEFAALQAQIGKTDALTAAGRRMDNLAGDVEIFGGVVEAIKLQVGGAFQEPARAVVQGLTTLVGQATPILQGWVEQAAAMVAPHVEGIMTTLTDSQWQADVSSQMAAFWENFSENNRVAFSLGDMVEVDFSTEGWNQGVTKFKLSDFFEFFSEDGVIEKVKIFDAVDYSFDGEVAKFSLGDFFDFVSEDGATTQIRLGDLIDYSSAGEQEFTLRVGAFEYAQQPEGDFVVTAWSYNGKPLGEGIGDEIEGSMELMGGYFDGFAAAVTQLTGWEMPKPSVIADEVSKSFGMMGKYFEGFGAAAAALSAFTWPVWEWPVWEWPVMPSFSWPVMPSFSWPAMPSFSWPSMPSFSWPAMPSFSWPAMPSFSWPSIPRPTWGWPEIPMPGWLGQVGAWFGGGGGAKAVGGRAGGLTWVGEFGPELVNLPSGSMVFSAGQSRRLAGEAGGGQVINVAATINTPLDVEELTRRIADRIKRRGF